MKVNFFVGNNVQHPVIRVNPRGWVNHLDFLYIFGINESKFHLWRIMNNLSLRLNAKSLDKLVRFLIFLCRNKS